MSVKVVFREKSGPEFDQPESTLNAAIVNSSTLNPSPKPNPYAEPPKPQPYTLLHPALNPKPFPPNPQP